MATPEAEGVLVAFKQRNGTPLSRGLLILMCFKPGDQKDCLAAMVEEIKLKVAISLLSQGLFFFFGVIPDVMRF